MESLDIVEKYLLDKYENNKQIMFEEPFYILDGYAVGLWSGFCVRRQQMQGENVGLCRP